MRVSSGSITFGLIIALMLFSPFLILLAGVFLILMIVAAVLDVKDWIKG